MVIIRPTGEIWGVVVLGSVHASHAGLAVNLLVGSEKFKVKQKFSLKNYTQWKIFKIKNQQIHSMQ